METILRSKEMAEIKLLPVRHHSPACAMHVQKVIEAWQPDAILIEGPDTANEWIPVMVHEDTKAPFAVYYSYDDTTGMISDEKEKYKCYYPFLDYSPELAALRTGAKLGVFTAFVDMPYGDILAASKAGKGLLKETEKSNYNDDYLLSRSTYTRMLCEKTGMRGFDEFWEKYFELEGLYEDSETWFGHLLTHCKLSREHTPVEELQEEGCLQREAYMAERILEIIDKRSFADPDTVKETARILVITGGFHTPALAELLGQEEKQQGTEKKQKLRRVLAKDQGVYMMPYSMEAADALNGYASGMPFPGFYQSVWEQMAESEAYDKTVLQYIVSSGKMTRSKEGGISTYDEICACSMARGLAALRGKREPGAYELQDAVLSSFVKGEYNIATDLPMRELRRLMTGNQVGDLCKNANEPPILQDFREQCKKFGLNIGSTLGEEVVLSIFSKKKHRRMSMFFHRVDFLQTDFAKRMKGPNLQSGKDRNLMCEIWKYKWNTRVMSGLIDASVYGASIEEAILGLVNQELKKDLPAKESTLLLTRVFEMGLDARLERVQDRVHELLLKDTDFYSLTAALRTLTMLQELGTLYQSEMKLQDLIAVCCRKVIALLPAMTRVKDEDMGTCMEALKTLYQLTGRRSMESFTELREGYMQVLHKMKQDTQIQPGVNGCIHGILYGCCQEEAAKVEQVCRGYLSGTHDQLMKTAMFFRGLFYAAKDLAFVGDRFLQMLDDFLQQVPEEDFMKLLPELRMAFTYFTPGEVDRIAASAAGLHGKKREDITDKKGIPGSFYAYGRELDGYVTACMHETEVEIQKQ